MLSLENTASRMSHLARQEIYFDRHFSLDETLAGVERVTADDVQRVARDLFVERVAGGDGARAAGCRELDRSAAGSRVTATIEHQSNMIRRYTHPEMGAIWSEQRRYETWLEVELAAADAMADAGIVPADAARELRAQGGLRHRPHRGDRADDAARRHRVHDRGRRAASGRRRAGCTSA